MVETTPVNRLANEKSPYLLQHAHNPVNWYPWSEEAFKKAQEENKPVFLSIGYSTCHWCHVMERESFADQEVANVLNENFVSIKVDREERPDIDDIYMSVCQAMTGRGGWPLTVVMTPDKRPFFAGTYFPKQTKRGRPGLLKILDQITKKWSNQQEKILESSEELVQAIKQQDMKKQAANFSSNDLDKLVKEAVSSLKSSFDAQYGGFGSAPKFPSPHNLMFLLRYGKIHNDQEVLSIVEKTLDSMYQGGIYDHIGYGFSRYATDEKWLAPHFEKMLYDNALLTIVYLEGYQVLEKEIYAKIAEEILAYINRDMTSSKGAFYSAEDADSEGEEGKYYLWQPGEVKEALGDKLGSQFCQTYNIIPEGNFAGKNIPNLIKTERDKLKINHEFRKARKKLFLAREKRVRPAKDDKILTAWNGLMIVAFAKAGKILDKEEYLNYAKEAADFIWDNLIRKDDGRLLARYREGEADYLGYVNDYAFYIWGLIELYQANFNANYLERALILNKDLIHFFWDQEDGGFYLYGSDGEKLITRPKRVRDGALPSGNSIATLNLLKLSKLVSNQELSDMAQQQFEYFYNQVRKAPRAYSAFLISVLFNQQPGKEVIIVKAKEETEMIDIFQQKFNPFSVVVVKDTKNNDKLIELISYIKDYQVKNGETTAYVCEDFSCLAPVTSRDKFKELIE